jgi:putative OPT family oligopeptide transporter
MAEFTLRAVVLGTVLSVLFGMVNAYLGLKIGLTVSASIPSAVLSMSILRGLLRRGTVLENNVVHTIASSGESLAAGVVFTAPALLFIGLEPDAFRLILIAATGGFLGILMMIPFRQQLSVVEHGMLPFPEGTACAQVLIAGDRGPTAARPVFLGIAIGALYQFLMRGLQLWRDTVFVTFPSLHKMSFGMELTPLFLGVGYLVGLRVAAMLAAGGFLSWAVLIPLFDLLASLEGGDWLGVPGSVAQTEARAIWSGYVRFVGAGAVTCGGLISIVRTFPVMQQSLRAAFGSLRAGPGSARTRVETDLPLPLVVLGVGGLAAAMWLIPAFELGLAQTLLAIVLGFFFVVVSARIVGIVGSTSQPVSGMTITALLATTFILKALGYEGATGMAASLAVAIIVCVAVALAGDISQDLKCGALIGATPRALQLGEMIGVAAAALRAGWVLFLLHQAYTIGSELLPAPQAKLMATLVQGVMQGELPWRLMLLGALLAGAAEVIGASSLAFAIGLYLPVTTTTPLIIGGLVAWWQQRRQATSEPATLFASGLIAGDALMGIGIAVLVVSGLDQHLALRSPASASFFEGILTVAAFAVVAWALISMASRRVGAAHRPGPG